MTSSGSAATVSAAFTEREITEPIDLCQPDGCLEPSAVGWSRRPLHRANLRGSWGRKKHWDYWCVTTREHMVSFTYADTSKHNTRPARGHIRVDGRRHEVGADNQGFGCLDYGRGIWPYRTTWNWTSASGVQGDRTIGIQLGGTWTDGTGSTENALCVNGRLSKISEDLVYEYDRRDFLRPWRIRAPRTERVDLSFTPFYCKEVKGDLRVLGGQLHLCFGHFAGVMVDDAGDAHRVDDLLGWSEEVRVRW